MLTSLQTPNRFDDPRGKPLNVPTSDWALKDIVISNSKYFQKINGQFFKKQVEDLIIQGLLEF